MSSEVTKTERDQTIKLDVGAKVYPAKDPKQEKGSILAFASADIGGCFAVTGIKIVEGKDGPFVAMPSQFGKDKQHHDICFPTTSAMREALNTVVMDAYRGVLEQQARRWKSPPSGISLRRRKRRRRRSPPSSSARRTGRRGRT